MCRINNLGTFNSIFSTYVYTKNSLTDIGKHFKFSVSKTIGHHSLRTAESYSVNRSVFNSVTNIF